MKKLLITVLFCSIIVAPAFAIENGYQQPGYYQTFIDTYVAKQKQKGMIIQSRNGVKNAIVPEPQKEEKVLQQSIKNGDDKNISK